MDVDLGCHGALGCCAYGPRSASPALRWGVGLPSQMLNWLSHSGLKYHDSAHTHTHPSNNISLTHVESDTPSISLPTWASRGRSSYTHLLHPTQGGSRLLVHGGGGVSGGCWAVSCIWSPVLSSWQHRRCLVLWGCCPLALRAPSLASLLLLLGGAHSCHRDV